MQIGRALGLIAIAALIGIILLHHNGSPSATAVSTHATTTTAPSHASTTTGTTPPTTTGAALRAPSSVKVLVANGTVAGGTTASGSTQHLAGTVSTTLHAQGYDSLAPVNATQNVTASIVYFQPGYEREAAVLAQSLGLPVSAVQSMPAQPPVPSSLNGANILVVAGPDLARSVASTTTTTAHAGTTTIPTTTIPTTTTVHR